MNRRDLMLTPEEKKEVVEMAVDKVINLMCAANWGEKQGSDDVARMADGIAMVMLWRRKDKEQKVERPPSEPKDKEELLKEVKNVLGMLLKGLEKYGV